MKNPIIFPISRSLDFFKFHAVRVIGVPFRSDSTVERPTKTSPGHGSPRLAEAGGRHIPCLCEASKAQRDASTAVLQRLGGDCREIRFGIHFIRLIESKISNMRLGVTEIKYQVM